MLFSLNSCTASIFALFILYLILLENPLGIELLKIFIYAGLGFISGYSLGYKKPKENN